MERPTLRESQGAKSGKGGVHRWESRDGMQPSADWHVIVMQRSAACKLNWLRLDTLTGKCLTEAQPIRWHRSN